MQLNPSTTPPGTWNPEHGVHHNFGQNADFHYHEVEEWLEVTQGAFSFYPAGELVSPGTSPITCKAGDKLHIPQGEVHRVEIVDPAGVTYTMWTPIHVKPDAEGSGPQKPGTSRSRRSLRSRPQNQQSPRKC
jgi:hypothetical protein